MSCFQPHRCVVRAHGASVVLRGGGRGRKQTQRTPRSIHFGGRKCHRTPGLDGTSLMHLQACWPLIESKRERENEQKSSSGRDAVFADAVVVASEPAHDLTSGLGGGGVFLLPVGVEQQEEASLGMLAADSTPQAGARAHHETGDPSPRGTNSCERRRMETEKGAAGRKCTIYHDKTFSQDPHTHASLYEWHPFTTEARFRSIQS